MYKFSIYTLFFVLHYLKQRSRFIFYFSPTFPMNAFCNNERERKFSRFRYFQSLNAISESRNAEFFRISICSPTRAVTLIRFGSRLESDKEYSSDKRFFFSRNERAHVLVVVVQRLALNSYIWTAQSAIKGWNNRVDDDDERIDSAWRKRARDPRSKIYGLIGSERSYIKDSQSWAFQRGSCRSDGVPRTFVFINYSLTANPRA